MNIGALVDAVTCVTVGLFFTASVVGVFIIVKEIKGEPVPDRPLYGPQHEEK